MPIGNRRKPSAVSQEVSDYSKVEKYVDSCSVKEPQQPLARIVSSPPRNVQVIVGFTIDQNPL